MTDPVSNPIWGDDWDAVRSEWALDPTVTFLNHGSFGATPRLVLEAQRALRDEMERQPVAFLDRGLAEMIRSAREACGQFLGTSGSNIAFVPNATTGVNAVMRSLRFEPGDEMLIADIGYPAVIKTMRRVAERCGATLVTQPIPFPRSNPAELTEALLAGMTRRTKIVVVDQVSSPTALAFPVAEIVKRCRDAGVLCLVDAAHAPGAFEVDLDELAPDFWTGNFHKWVCSPKGSAVLYVHPDHHAAIVPPVTSHYFEGAFPDEFIWMGTDDPTAYLSIPAAIEFMANLGWDRVRRHNHELARYGRRVVSDALGVEPPYPDGSEWYNCMSLIALPNSVRAETKKQTDAAQAELYRRTRIEVPFIPLRGRAYVRLSAQVYNAPAHYDALAAGLVDLFGAGQ
ncbi:MAG: aminotransferase class V-fold PLP-dependent enzyme [Phycisphaerales bacterium]